MLPGGLGCARWVLPRSEEKSKKAVGTAKTPGKAGFLRQAYCAAGTKF